MGESKRRKKLDPSYGKPINAFLKQREIHKISYYVIVERPDSIDYEIPKNLTLGYIDIIYDLPKSIIQVYDPLLWNLMSIKAGEYSNIEFNLIFDDYASKEYENIFNQKWKIIVIFLFSKSNLIFDKINSLTRSFLIYSDNKEIQSKIKKSENLSNKYFGDLNTFYGKITNFSLKELNVSHTKFMSHQKDRKEKVKEILKDLDLVGEPGFLPCRSNIANIKQFIGIDCADLIEHIEIPFSGRVDSLIKTSLALNKLSEWIKTHEFLDLEKTLVNLPENTLIFIYPYFNPKYKKIVETYIQDFKCDEKKKLQKFKSFRFLEQEIDNYTYKAESTTLDDTVGHTLSIKQAYLRYLDFVGYLHSTFNSSSYIRTPSRGATLNSFLSRLSPEQYKKSNSNLSTSKNINEIGKAISINCPKQYLDFIGSDIHCIFSISDLPLEWMLIDGVPLSFLCDHCRIPETGPTSILAQYNLNSNKIFKINKNLLSKTLVICGALNGDPILEKFKIQFNSIYI
ncbi:hypothetical protein [Altericista sp. CCNU0014]|uniref:hypothetical protein n=1 Tax=Altericista sp. CCNU0014 TaxID=3082949 RepID=UPI00384E7FAC